MSTLRHLVGRAACTAVALVLLSGCAGQGNAEAHNAEAVAIQFIDDAQSDPSAACLLLAPETVKALEDVEGACPGSLAGGVHPMTRPGATVEVYGKDAIVHLVDDTLFLARFTEGWRVTAAGCTPQPDRPYDCRIRGN